MGGRERKENILKDVVKFTKSEKSKSDREDLRRFIDGFYASAPPDDIIGSEPKCLFDYAARSWSLSKKRKPHTATVDVRQISHGDGQERTAIHIVNDDMPFLVDSITGGLTVTQKRKIFVLHHPLINVRRDAGGTLLETIGPVRQDSVDVTATNRESYIYIETDPAESKADEKALENSIRQILSDVRAAVEDWRPMLSKVEETIESLEHMPDAVNPELVGETQQLLRWLIDDHFTFLGYREYSFDGDPRTAEFRAVRGSGLGLLRDPSFYILRGPTGLTAISSEIREFLTQPDPVIITKANVKTRVHRPIHLDYIGVKLFDKKGRVVGERRFVGLFTSQSYSRRAVDVPLIRRKIRNVQAHSGLVPHSHGAKTLLHILETFPRDELFQINEEQLMDVCLGVLHLLERPRPRAFLRPDKFERFVSALVYVPRDKYNSVLRTAIERILCEAFNGQISAYYAQLSDDVLARWHFIVRTRPGEVPPHDPDEINQKIEIAATDWLESLQHRLVSLFEKEKGEMLYRKYRDSFTEAYKEAFDPYQAGCDIREMEKIKKPGELVFAIYQTPDLPDNRAHLKIYGAKGLVPLSDCMPMLENLGFRVIGEHAYLLNGGFGSVHDFLLESAKAGPVDVKGLEDQIESLLGDIWVRKIEDDGFNALTTHAGIDGWNVVILRAYAKYMRQLGMNLSQDYIEDTLLENTDVAKKLIELFEVMFRPNLMKKAEREEKKRTIRRAIHSRLDRIRSLDQDRILRGYLTVIGATVRTNFYQRAFRGKPREGMVRPGLALKIQSRKIDWAPKPRPFAEIFVYSPRFEGVHLRSGPVARGGLRWSDRREDFRTEVLGLVKAQQVKNAVIVPVGAKGGFVPKNLPTDGDREAVMNEGIACYKSFITSLLSVTDNLIEGKVIPPKATVRWDDNDPYLVVAADKGTATFSDIANSLATACGFWLGDAFASGGSNGYDHKKMGITAKGAWVSVERHFREMGHDVSSDPTRVIGVGDMSGDVFGNGMLLSKSLKLVAAFDHRHIFFDPDPDMSKSYKERKRLFALSRSSWDDYNKKLISKGGGVFERSLKSIRLSSQFRAFLGVDAKELTPSEVLHHILKAEADLMWFGGIGTYVKASTESNAEVGDRANDALRIDGRDLKVRVIGEGGNLGMTQRGRIEFAKKGGCLNTDFIDNSAGVDCSDKEVNIKILLNQATTAGTLEPKDRDALLARMTDAVSNIVLSDNYLQTQAITLAEYLSKRDRERHVGLIRVLERDAGLDREIETLPSEERVAEMAVAGEGLSRPEISVLLAYTKMSLYDVLMRSDGLDDQALRPQLEQGFPEVLRERFAGALDGHQLRREIIATTLANEVVNRGGLTFVYELKEETGLAVEQIVSAFILSREAYGLSALWRNIDNLDYKVDADIQISMHLEVMKFLRHQCAWFLHNNPNPLSINKLIETYRDALAALLHTPEKVLSPLALGTYRDRVSQYREGGVPMALAKAVAVLSVMESAPDIVQVGLKLKRNIEEVGRAYYEVGHRMGFDWLAQAAIKVKADEYWDKLAIQAVLSDLAGQQRELARHILTSARGTEGSRAVEKWMTTNAPTRARAEHLISEMKASGKLSIAKLSFAVRHMRSILPL